MAKKFIIIMNMVFVICISMKKMIFSKDSETGKHYVVRSNAIADASKIKEKFNADFFGVNREHVQEMIADYYKKYNQSPFLEFHDDELDTIVAEYDETAKFVQERFSKAASTLKELGQESKALEEQAETAREKRDSIRKAGNDLISEIKKNQPQQFEEYDGLSRVNDVLEKSVQSLSEKLKKCRGEEEIFSTYVPKE